MLFVMDKAGSIISGNIVYFLPADGKKRDALSPHTIQNIFNNKPVSDNGMFKFLSVSGTWIYQLEYKNGKLYSNGIIKTNKVNGAQKTNSSCIDWYLVTTYNYANGSSYQTSEYVGTTCDGCDNLNYESLCPGSDGGGGSDIQKSSEVVIEESYETSIDNEEGSGISAPPGGAAARYYQPIKYSHYATVHRSTVLGYTYVEGVTIDPTTADPMQSQFIDSYGISGTRKLTILNHNNSWMPLVPPFVLITWECSLYGLYLSIDGRVWSHYWNHSHMRVAG